MNERATTLSDAFWNLDPFAVVDRDHPFFVDMGQFLDPVDYGVGPFLRRWLSPDGRRRGFLGADR